MNCSQTRKFVNFVIWLALFYHLLFRICFPLWGDRKQLKILVFYILKRCLYIFATQQNGLFRIKGTKQGQMYEIRAIRDMGLGFSFTFDLTSFLLNKINQWWGSLHDLLDSFFHSQLLFDRHKKKHGHLCFFCLCLINLNIAWDPVSTGFRHISINRQLLNK